MKKLAILLSVCMLALCATAYAEDSATLKPAMVANREVWRGEVTAIDEGVLTVKILEYNPEAPKLPLEENMTEGGEATPENTPAAIEGNPEDEETPAGKPVEGGAAALNEAMPAEDDAATPNEATPAEEEDAPSENPEAPAEDGDTPKAEDAAQEGTPVEAVNIPVAEETHYYTYSEEEFTEASLEDVAVGCVVTVEMIDGTASVVVVETDANAAEELQQGAGL